MITKKPGSNISTFTAIGNCYYTDGVSSLELCSINPLPDKLGYVIIESQLGTFDCIKLAGSDNYGIGYDLPQTFTEYNTDGAFSSTIQTINIGFGYYSIPFTIKSGYIESDGYILPFGGVYNNSDIAGTVRLQNDRWQLISVPINGVKVKEGFLDKLAELTNRPINDIIESCSAYFGDRDIFDMYIPGVTNDNATGNFPLIYNDNGTSEITAFWVKTKDYYQFYPQDIIFNWGS